VRKGYAKFIAGKMIAGKKYYIGTFDTPELAHAAYLKFDGKKNAR